MTAPAIGRRRSAALAVLAAGVLAAGALTLGTETPAAPHFHRVAVPGGVLQVDAVTPATPMRMGGMPMGSGPNMKDVPKGDRRFTVAVTLIARTAELRVSPDRFRVRAPGTGWRSPIDDDTAVVHVPPGTSLPRELTFYVPRRARTVELRVGGGAHPVSLALGAAQGDHARH